MIWKDNSLYVGFFLALREIKRSNPWTTGLIIFVMTLTFFNMLLLGGVLLGIASGVIGSFKQAYSSDILITPATQKSYIDQTASVNDVVKSLPTLAAETVRYTAQGTLEYNYQNKLFPTDIAESAGGVVVGIDPIAENNVTQLASTIIAGSYLNSSDANSILVGSNLIRKYTTASGQTLGAGSQTLRTADIGSRVLLTINGVQKEVFIKGVVRTNNSIIDSRIFMVDYAFRELTSRSSLNANEIAIKIKPNASDTVAKNYIQKNLNGDNDITLQTAEEAVPSATAEIIQTFTILGSLIGFIALIVGAVTIFIVIYVNAITRRKFIGILKGIGISSRAIEISYVFQALFYAFAGIGIASILVLGFLVPYFALHPVTYPIGKGSLAITPSDVFIRAVILSITSLISGYVPAWLIAKQNTLDAILGR
jgi:putative ABC transport system permease protein